MSHQNVDVIIVGQGLAGSTLGWVLHEAGLNVLILDENASVSSSKIAAGLITPITGKRLVLSRDYEKFFTAAKEFYAVIERKLGVQIFHERSARRIFQTKEEEEIWARRQKDPAYQAYIIHERLDSGLEGFEMRAAQLDVATYLACSKDYFNIEIGKLNWRDDVIFHEDRVQIGKWATRYIISCEGYSVTDNPHFKWVRFNPAKGEILTIRFEEEVPVLTYHHGVWMAATGAPNTFFVGSTYDWENLNETPTAQARADIEQRLRAFIDVPFKVLDHQAAVRPIIFQSLARIGMHPNIPRLGFFNGLGSKGSLQAPWYSKKLTAHIIKGTKLEKDTDICQHWSSSIL